MWVCGSSRSPAIEDPKLLENAIRFRAQEVVPIPLSDAILDHFVLGDTELDGAPAFRVLLAFAHRELVDRYVEAFKKARLKVASVDFEAFALLRAVTSPRTVRTPIGRPWPWPSARSGRSSPWPKGMFAISRGCSNGAAGR